MILRKEILEQVAARIPFLAEWDVRLRPGTPPAGRAVRRLVWELPRWKEDIEAIRPRVPPTEAPRRVVLFAMMDRWIYMQTLVALVLAGLGHEVTLAFLPYANWFSDIGPYTLRRRDAYHRQVLNALAPQVRVVSLLQEPAAPLSQNLYEALEAITYYDVQYSLQREIVPETHPIWALRRRRNREAAARMVHLLTRLRADVLIVPNGLILEFGAVYQAARSLDILAVTYEFDEQREYAWISRTEPVMWLPVDDLWTHFHDQPLTEEETRRIRQAMQDRWQGRVWERSERQWQPVPPQGSLQVARRLGLDTSRPLFLLAPNVFGDSVVLGRNVFSQGLTDWVQGTVRFFAEHPEAQLVIRVHPGERLLGPEGLSMAQVARTALPQEAPNIHLIEAHENINTFDLVPLATAGLVYTSTIGLEMVLQGVPVVVAGKAFYRGKGFTLDPETWDAYFALLTRLMQNPRALAPTREQVERAWRFAYTFFYRFPRPFPWHMHHVTEQTLEGRTPAWALQQPPYHPTWAYMVAG